MAFRLPALKSHWPVGWANEVRAEAVRSPVARLFLRMCFNVLAGVGCGSADGAEPLGIFWLGEMSWALFAGAVGGEGLFGTGVAVLGGFHEFLERAHQGVAGGALLLGCQRGIAADAV